MTGYFPCLTLRGMTVGEHLVYWSARGAAMLYAVSVGFQIVGRGRGPRAGRLNEVVARETWVTGAFLIWVHVAFALHFTYRWNHEAMVQDIARQSKDLVGFYWRGGAYINYAFVLVWGADAVWWCFAGEGYRRRPAW